MATGKLLTPKEIKQDVLDVLIAKTRDKKISSRRYRTRYLTAYQILGCLSETVRERLRQERGPSGRDSGNTYAAASVVAQACLMLEREDAVLIASWDARGSEFTLPRETKSVRPSAPVCALYSASVPPRGEA